MEQLPDIQTAPAAWRVCVVIPVRNGREFLDQTLFSLVSQAGPFRLHIHVQDGGSTDGTLSLVDAWIARLRDSAIPCLCLGIDITRDSAPDSGMYDAINRGFHALAVQPDDVLFWINADDYLLPGAIRFVIDRMTQFPQVAWIVSRPCESDVGAVTTRIHDVQVYPAATLLALLHDGRHLRFVMQEGSFWRGWLWQKSGGLRADLRLAGDFDLWSRFAPHAAPHAADIVLGVHRHRPNQLSANIAAYYAEIDDHLMTPELKVVSRSVWHRYSAWYDAEPYARGTEFFGPVFLYDAAKSAWIIENRPLPVPLRPPSTLSPAGALVRTLPPRFLTGFSGPQPGAPAWNLPAGARFTSSGTNILEFNVPKRGIYQLQIVCRNFSVELRVSVLRLHGVVLSLPVPSTGHECDSILTGSLYLDAGVNQLELVVDGPAAAPHLGLLIQTIGIIPL